MNRRFRRILLALLAVCYLATVVIGIAEVHSAIAADVLARWKRAGGPSREQFVPGYPEITFKATVPVLPFIIVSRHEYVVGPLYAWSGVEFFVWFPFSARSIGRVTFWVS